MFVVYLQKSSGEWINHLCGVHITPLVIDSLRDKHKCMSQTKAISRNQMYSQYVPGFKTVTTSVHQVSCVKANRQLSIILLNKHGQYQSEVDWIFQKGISQNTGSVNRLIFSQMVRY